MARRKLTWTIDADSMADYASRTLDELQAMLARIANHPSDIAQVIEAELEHVVNERRRAQGLPLVRNAHKPFRLCVTQYRYTRPQLVDGAYTSAQKVQTGPARIIGFDTAQQAERYRYDMAMKIGNCEITITGPDTDGGRRFLSVAQLKSAARAEYAPRAR